MPTAEVDEIRIRLKTIEALFAAPEANPFNPDSRFETGIDELAQQMTTKRLRQTQTRLVISLPGAAITPGLTEKTRGALVRYCAVQIEASQRELQQLRRRGRFSFISAVIIIGVAMALALFIGQLEVLGATLQSFLIGGFSVFSWVAVWEPFNIYLYNWRPPARNRLIFERLQQAELVIEPE